MKRLLYICLTTLLSCGPQPQTSINTPVNSPKEIYENEFLNHVTNSHYTNPYEKMGTAQAGDWLETHPEEGQTYKQFRINTQVLPNYIRNTLYIQPIGPLVDDDSVLINTTAEYLQTFYSLPVKILPEWDSSIISLDAQRTFFGSKQYHTKHILYDLLKLKLPPNAVAYMAITSVDLYPDEDWHFVFGQASTKDRVGVSSLARLKKYYGDNQLNFNLSFKRISKTSSHEIGHMLGIKHCTEFKCIMNGSNHLAESDSKPMWLCPQCLPKVAYATNQSIHEHINRLEKFHKSKEMSEQNHYSHLKKIISDFEWKIE